VRGPPDPRIFKTKIKYIKSINSLGRLSSYKDVEADANDSMRIRQKNEEQARLLGPQGV